MESSWGRSKRALTAQLEPWTELLKKFDEYPPSPSLRLTDFLVLNAAEESLKQQGRLRLPDRLYDDKFGILQSPSPVIDDLSYYREAKNHAKTQGKNCVAFYERGCEENDLRIASHD